MKFKLPVLLLVAGLWASGNVLAAQMSPGPAQSPAAQAPAGQLPTVQAAPASSGSDSSPKATTQRYVVPSGTRLPLILHNAVTTRNAKPGDPVYLETLFPVVIDNRILIPAGSYVQGRFRKPGALAK